MDRGKQAALQRAVELSITHRQSSWFGLAPQMSNYSSSAASTTASHHLTNHLYFKNRSRRRRRNDRTRSKEMVSSEPHGDAASTYPSQRSANQRVRSSPPSSPSSAQHHQARYHAHKNTRTSSSAPASSSSSSQGKHNSHHSYNHHNSSGSTDRHPRRRRREEEEEDEDVDSDTNSNHRVHGERVARRSRRESIADSSSAPAAAAVTSLLPATSVAACVLPLDAKVIELLYALSPTSDDREGKLRVVEEVRECVRKAGLDIQIYGSLCTGLAIPASDVDCVMMRSSDPMIAAAMPMGLSSALLNIDAAATSSLPQRAARASLSTGIRTAADRMRRHPAFTNVSCIAHAKVPIVKCRHRRENVKVDLSFEKDGCVSSNYLCELFCEPGNELARPLIVLIKALVNHCGLDDPSVGGLGSFPISLLVLWYLKHCVPSRYTAELRRSIAVLLVGFLQYYGTEFDFQRQGIDYVQQKMFAKPPARDLFIVNPIRPGTNCTRAATLYATHVVPQFQKAAAALAPMLDVHASATAMEQRLLQCFAKSLPGVLDWRDVARAAAQGSHLPQNMWDQATNLYMGGVL